MTYCFRSARTWTAVVAGPGRPMVPQLSPSDSSVTWAPRATRQWTTRGWRGATNAARRRTWRPPSSPGDRNGESDVSLASRQRTDVLNCVRYIIGPAQEDR